MDLLYAAEKFGAAIEKIVTTTETLTPQRKVEIAATEPTLIGPDNFPNELRDDFRRWKEQVSKVKDEVLGSFAATSLSLSDREAGEILKRFYTFHYKINTALEFGKDQSE